MYFTLDTNKILALYHARDNFVEALHYSNSMHIRLWLDTVQMYQGGYYYHSNNVFVVLIKAVRRTLLLCIGY